MNKTIYEVRPLAHGKLNNDLFEMIALHNSGVKGSFLNLDLIEAYIKADNGTTQRFEDVLMVGENGTHTMTIRELQFIGKITDTEADIINQQNLS